MVDLKMTGNAHKPAGRRTNCERERENERPTVTPAHWPHSKQFGAGKTPERQLEKYMLT